MNPYDKNILRLFDANLNRALEGIRVIEETARMIFNDEALTRSIKEVRHALNKVIKSEKDFDAALLKARGSEYDVLRDGETQSERTRADVNAVIQANSGRTQEALRTLEEYSKLLYPPMSEQFKKIRFQLYDIEKSLILIMRSCNLVNEDRMGIYVIVDHDVLSESSLHELACIMIEEGAGTIAYSDKSSSDREFLNHAEKVFDACRDKNVTAIIHDRLDCAMILGVDGVHVEQSGIPVRNCKQIVGSRYIIGYTETIGDGIEYRIQNDADYVLLNTDDSNIFTPEKMIAEVKRFVSTSTIPVIVKGKLTDETIYCLFDSGVTGFVLEPDTGNPEKILETIRSCKKLIKGYQSDRQGE